MRTFFLCILFFATALHDFVRSHAMVMSHSFAGNADFQKVRAALTSA
jgi:hypothetical protein